MGAWAWAAMLKLELEAREEIREGMTAFVPVKKHEAGASAARTKQVNSKPNLIIVPCYPVGERGTNIIEIEHCEACAILGPKIIM